MSRPNIKIKNAAILFFVICFGIFILCFLFEIWVRLFPDSTVEAMLNDAIVNSEYYFEDAELLSYESSFLKIDKSVSLKISPDKAVEMMSDNVLKNRPKSSKICSSLQECENYYGCVESSGTMGREESLCIDAETGVVSYRYYYID